MPGVGGLPRGKAGMEPGPLPAAAIDEDALRYRFVKKKGYVRLHTNRGDLNLELHCDMVGVAWPCAHPVPGGSRGLKWAVYSVCAVVESSRDSTSHRALTPGPSGSPVTALRSSGRVLGRPAPAAFPPGRGRRKSRRSASRVFRVSRPGTYLPLPHEGPVAFVAPQ